jgi:hypothetical protein
LIKKYWLYSLSLVLFAVICLAYAQQKSTPQTDALRAKQQGEAVQKQRFDELMSKIGVEVPETTNPTAITAYRQLNISLSSSNKTTSPASAEQQQSAAIVQVKSNEVKRGSLPRHRSFELATNQLVLLTVDERSRLRWWSMMPDPRILRAEGPGPNGTLTGEVLFQSTVDFTVNIPNDSAAVELRLYHPQWTGQEFELVLISKLPLTN